MCLHQIVQHCENVVSLVTIRTYYLVALLLTTAKLFGLTPHEGMAHQLLTIRRSNYLKGNIYMFLRRFVLVSLALAFLQGGSAWAATYWVSSSGNDGNSCSVISGVNDPGRYRTVNGGLSCLSAGDTLKIKNGTYNYSFPATPLPSGPSSSQKTCIVGESRDGVVFRPDSSKNGWVIGFTSARSNICIKNITLDGINQGTSGSKAGIAQGGSGGHRNWEITDVVIKNFGINLTDPTSSAGGTGIVLDDGGGGHYMARLVFDNNGTIGFDHGNHIYWRAANSVIEHSVFRRHSRDSLHMYFKNGYGVDNNVIRYNQFSGGAARAINIASGVNNLVHDNVITNGRYANGGIFVRRYGNKIYNNTVYGVSSYCIRLDQGPLDVRNNIFLNCGSSAIRNDSTGSTISNNLTSGKASDIFINPEAGDFRLKTAIGVGATITAASTPITVLTPPPTPGNLQAAAQ
jgi:hypothetical protein